MTTVSPADADKAPQKRGGFLDTINRAINGTLERIFEYLGRLVGARPVVVIIRASLQQISCLRIHSHLACFACEDTFLLGGLSLCCGGVAADVRYDFALLPLYGVRLVTDTSFLLGEVSLQ